MRLQWDGRTEGRVWCRPLSCCGSVPLSQPGPASPAPRPTQGAQTRPSRFRLQSGLCVQSTSLPQPSRPLDRPGGHIPCPPQQAVGRGSLWGKTWPSRLQPARCVAWTLWPPGALLDVVLPPLSLPPKSQHPRCGGGLRRSQPCPDVSSCGGAELELQPGPGGPF